MTNPCETFTCEPSIAVERSAQALAAFLKNASGEHLNRVLAAKLLWASDRFSIREHGSTITESPYLALEYGPVASTPLTAMRQRFIYVSEADNDFVREHFQPTEHGVKLLRDPGEDLLSEADVELIQRSQSMFSHIDPFKLSEDISHNYPEWKKFAEALAQKKRRSFPIEMLDFFEDPVGEDPYFSADREQLDAAKSIFKRNVALFGEYKKLS